MPEKTKATVYIDGLNFYYGMLKHTPFKWLNYQRLFELLRANDDIQTIYYFTALVNGKKRRLRQDTYLKALETQPLVEVVQGHFKFQRIECRYLECPLEKETDAEGKRVKRFFKKPEEKCTDVNLALYMLRDAYENAADRFIMVTGDGDMAPAVHLIKERFPEKQVFLYVPSRHRSRGAATDLRSAVDQSRTLPFYLLKKSLFPSTVISHSGEKITKPEGW